MIDAPLAYAFTAGLVASVNPCGFPMLPAYLSFFVGSEEGGGGAPARVLRAVVAAAAVSAGFFAVFVALGIPIHAGRTWLYRVAPWLTIVVGVVLVGLGAALVAGYRLRLALPRLDRGGQRRTLRSMTLFGVSYAIASLGCTLPIFLGVVAGASRRANLASGVAAFAAYALGMSVVLLALSVAVALARDSLVGHLRRALPYVHRAAGALLVVAGAYLVYYWVTNLASDPADPVGASPIAAVDDLSADLAARLASGGVGLGLALGALVAAGVVVALLRRRAAAR